MKRERSEIIISEKFSSLCTSEYELGNEDESIPKKRQRVINTSDLVNRLVIKVANRRPDEILPQNCRFVQPMSNGGRVVVIEDPPCSRTIHLDMNLEANIEKLRKTGKLEHYGYTKELQKLYKEGPYPHRVILGFPYVVYIMSITKFFELYSLRVFYRVHPITSPSDYLFQPNLLNIDGSFNVCLGEGSNSGDSTPSTCINTINRFWNNSFNTDYLQAYRNYEDVGEVSDFLTWQYYTHRDPMFVFKVDWKPHKRTLKEEISSVAGSKVSKPASYNFYKLTELFTEPIRTDEKNVYIDPCESILVGGTPLSLGDKIDIDGKAYWINGFKGMLGYPPQAVVLMDDEEEMTEKLLTEKLKNDLEEKLVKVNSLESLELGNGVTIKPGDVVELAGPFKSYRKVHEIRIAPDDSTEVKLGTDFYFADVLDLKLFDQKVELYGVEMIPGREYTLINRVGDVLVYMGRPAKLMGIDVNNDGMLSVMFKDQDSGYEVNETYESLEHRYKLVEEDTSVYCPVFRIGPKMFTADEEEQRHRIMKGTGVLYTNSYRDGALRFSYNRGFALEHLLTNGEFNLPSYDVDLNFRVGDKVIFADWERPEDITTVREIIGISHDDHYIKISAQSNEGDVRTMEYADISNGRVFIGKIRKIEEEYNGLRAGTKLKANVSGISKFPKKDVNQIIGFLTDTGTGVPLMLCSNRCTLWAHDEYLSKFSYLPPSSQLWSRVQVAPPPTRFAQQIGDLTLYSYSSRWAPYMVTRDGHGRTRKFPTTHMCKYITTGSIHPDDRVTKWGILQPRFTQRQLDQFEVKYVHPNMHGGFMEVPDRKGLRVKADWRCACSTSS